MSLIKNPKCIYKKIDEIGVILEPEGGKFIELNTTALEIWHLLDEMNSLDLIKKNLLEKYHMDEAMKADVADFINEALAANIILKT
jgi:hypothetical protein